MIAALAFGGVSFGGNDSSKPKKKEKGLVKVHVETEINASADKVWEILGKNFAEIDQWTETISTSDAVSFQSVPEGFTAASAAPVAGRRTVSKKITATEILTAYSDENQTFTFKAADGPKFLGYAQNNSSVISLSENKSKVVFDIEVKLEGFVKVLAKKFQKKMIKTMTGIQQDLKVFAENGKSIIND